MRSNKPPSNGELRLTGDVGGKEQEVASFDCGFPLTRHNNCKTKKFEIILLIVIKRSSMTPTEHVVMVWISLSQSVDWDCGNAEGNMRITP